MPTLLCYGDSNTHGTAPIHDRDAPRARISPRWPQVTAQALGWDLVEEGLPGRTTARPCPVMGPHMDGRIGLFIALESHGPVDAMTLMLGTNDLKAHFDAPAEAIANDIGFLLDVALSEEMQARHGGFEPFLICPPLPFSAGAFTEEFAGVEAKTDALVALYQSIAAARDVAFFDANSVISCSAIDGIHFDEGAHRRLGAAVAKWIEGEIETDSA